MFISLKKLISTDDVPRSWSYLCWCAGGGADARTKRKAGATALNLLERSSKIMTSGLKTKAVVEQESNGLP